MNEFAIDRRNNVLLVKFADSLTPATLETFNDQLRDFVAREGTMAVVIDLSGVSSGGVETSTLTSRLLRVYAAHQEANGEKPPLVVQSLADAFQHFH